MPLDEGTNLGNIVGPPNIEPQTADQVNNKAMSEGGIREGRGRTEQARTVEIGSSKDTCPVCRQNTLKADMRRKVNRIYCENPSCSYDQADGTYASGVAGTGVTGVTVMSKRGIEGENNDIAPQQGVKILSNRTPSQ